MKVRSIFFIYIGDLKRIVTNWAAIIVVLALMILPSLYAWFNIEASWDPYGNTKGLKIAVVNEDTGATVRGKYVNVGDEVVKSLRKNKALGWTFVTENAAKKGVKYGDYYASIHIPKNFSTRIASILEDEPKKPEIVYTVNEKINAIAPKITSKGASSVVEEISQNFIKTANGAIFQVFNELGITLAQDLPTIKDVEARIFELDKRFPEIRQVVNEALTTTQKADDLVGKAESALPTIDKLAKDGQELSGGLVNFLNKSDETLDAIAPNIKQDLIVLQQTANAVQNVTTGLLDENPDLEGAKARADQAIERITISTGVIDRLLSLFEKLNSLASNSPLSQTIERLKGVQTRLNEQKALIEKLKTAVESGQKPAESLINQLNDSSKRINDELSSIVDRYDSEIVPAVNDAVTKAKNTATTANGLLTEANKSMPEVKGVLSKAAEGVNLGEEELSKLQKDLPGMEQKVHNIAKRIRSFQQQADIQQIIDLLRKDVKQESDFFANPVLLKEYKLYPIPNYGSAMSPFFSTLSLWVGGLLLVSLLRTDVEDSENMLKSHHEYFGRLFTFVTIALCQSLIVTLGDLFILHTHVVDKGWFVLFGLFNSLVFMTIIYTLVSIFGNAGKALSIVLLVLQLSGAGGTFPIQVAPQFFQNIHPFLPFTYSISMMREAVGGILWGIAKRDILILVCVLVGAILFGVFLKKPLSKSSKRLTEKAKESKLIH
nr:YhgE/Pip domain-containing protein [Priestia koreensis]